MNSFVVNELRIRFIACLGQKHERKKRNCPSKSESYYFD